MTLWLYRSPEPGGSLEASEHGHLQLQLLGGWDAGGWNLRANAEVSVAGMTDEQGVSMSLEPLAFGNAVGADKQVTGHWFNPADSGWGLTIDRKGETEVTVAYFYDAEGQPRWALGNRQIDEPVTEVLAFDGYCLSCDTRAPSSKPAGSVTLNFDSDGRSGTVDLDVAWPPGADQRWSRPEAGIIPLSDPPEFRYMPESGASAAGLQTTGTPAPPAAVKGATALPQEQTCLHWHHPELPLGLGRLRGTDTQ
jgi:hypothetical protein